MSQEETVLTDSHLDDSDLPDLSDVFRTSDNRPVTAGDIVLAKFQKLYWPALVRTVYPGQKKISVWFCDEPGKTFMIPMKNICAFHDHDRRLIIERDIVENGYGDAFYGLMAHADLYLKRKNQGYKDDPVKYFDQTYPYFLIEKLQKKNPCANISDLKIPPIYIANELKNTPMRPHFTRKESADGVKSDELLQDELEDAASNSKELTKDINSFNIEDSDIEIDTQGKAIDAIIKFKNLSEDINSSDNELANEIVMYVLSGKANNYLQDILLKNIPSEFCYVYEQAAQCGKRDLKTISFTGPIQDNNKVIELTNYLLSLHSELSNTASSSTRPTYPICNTSDAAHYVASVWLPESIIYALSEIHKISLSEAKKRFDVHGTLEKFARNVAPSISVKKTKKRGNRSKIRKARKSRCKKIKNKAT